MAVAICSVISLFAVSAHAYTWHTCQVVQAGPGWGKTYIMLTDTDGTSPAFQDQWFQPRNDLIKEMLATALTAMTGGQYVRVCTDLKGTYPYLQALYLQPVGTP